MITAEPRLAVSSEPSPLLRLTAQIVAAHAVHNPMPTDDLPGLIESVYAALATAAGNGAALGERATGAH